MREMSSAGVCVRVCVVCLHECVHIQSKNAHTCTHNTETHTCLPEASRAMMRKREPPGREPLLLADPPTPPLSNEPTPASLSSWLRVVPRFCVCGCVIVKGVWVCEYVQCILKCMNCAHVILLFNSHTKHNTHLCHIVRQLSHNTKASPCVCIYATSS